MSFFELLSIYGASVITAVATAWFIFSQFSSNRRMFYKVMSLHNREDDDRFEHLNNEIWNIHVRNAQKDGDSPPKRRTFPRRRYLQESAEAGEFGDVGS